MPPEEIACDESGYEGEKLINTTTDVFAHAGVRLAIGDAAQCMQELRRRIRSPATQYKANHLLREKHRPVLEWVLGPSSPLTGNAHVFLIDKVFSAIDDLLPADGPAAPILAELRAARARADALRDRLSAGTPLMSVLDPLTPALIRAVVRWGAHGRGVAIVHDRQTMLPVPRIRQLQTMLTAPGPRLAGLTLVESEFDPRVQLADILAGAARKIASDALNGCGDPWLLTLLGPYVDPSSIWGDDVTRPGTAGGTPDRPAEETMQP